MSIPNRGHSIPTNYYLTASITITKIQQGGPEVTFNSATLLDVYPSRHQVLFAKNLPEHWKSSPTPEIISIMQSRLVITNKCRSENNTWNDDLVLWLHD